MEQLLPILCVGIIGLVLVITVVWWLTGRILKPGLLRTVARLVVVVGLVVLGYMGFQSMQSTLENAVASGVVDTTSEPIDLTVAARGDLAITLSATGSIEPHEKTTLSFETMAPVEQVFVEQGQAVQSGEVLAQLDPTDAESRLRLAEVALQQQQVVRDDLLRPARDIDIAVAEAAVNAARSSVNASAQGPTTEDLEIARLQSELARNQLWQTQLTRDITLATNPEFRGYNARADEATLQSGTFQADYGVYIADENYANLLNDGPNAGSLSAAYAQLVAAEARLNNLLEGATDLELERSQIDIESAQLGVDQAKEYLNKMILKAPFNGVIAEENLTVGEYPPQDAVILIDTVSFLVDLSIDETDITKLQLGQRVMLSIDALPDAEITGTITHLDDAPTIVGQLVTYNAEVTLDPTEARVRTGMSATANVIIDDLKDVIVLPNRFIRVDEDTQETMVTVKVADGQYQNVSVVLGIRNSQESQIVSGLTEGQTVVILPRGEETYENPFGGGGQPPMPE